VGATTTGRAGSKGTFGSLRIRNYRLYFTGQLISMAGTFMQTVAQGWLVLKLSGSTTALGLVVAFQCIPMLLLGPSAGVLIDRSDRRRLWIFTQTLAGLSALCLGIVTITGVVELWMVFGFALVLGTIMSVDQTTKIALIPDLVEREDVANAISLNQALNQIAKIVGPALAGGLIAVIGVGPCFILNAASFLGVIVGLAMMRPEEMHREAVQARAPRQVREGLAFVRRTPELLSILLSGAVFFGLVWGWDVVLPGLAKYTFHGGPGLYGFMMSVLAVGSCIGALGAARRSEPSLTVITVSGAATGVAMIAAALAPTLPIFLGLLVATGIAGMTFISSSSARLLTRTPTPVRGRITALWMVAAIGTRPFGSPAIGWIGQVAGPRAAVAAGGIAMLAVAVPLRWLIMLAASPAKEAAAAVAAPLLPELEPAYES
jgi:MFS family permease